MSSARRMSPEVTTSPSNSDDKGFFGSEETISGHPSEEFGEASSPKIARPEKKRKLCGRTLAEHYPIDLMTCITTVDDLEEIRTVYKIHSGIDLRIPRTNDTPSRPPKGFVTLFLESFKLGMRLPLQTYFIKILSGLHLAPGQLNPNGWRVLSGLFILWDRCGQSEPTIDELKHLYQLKNSPKHAGWYYFMSSTKTRKPITDLPLCGGGNWKKKLFFAGLKMDELRHSYWCIMAVLGK